MRLTLIVSLVIAVLAVIFALVNPQQMQVNFLFGEASGSTALVLIITFVIGVVVGLLAAIPGRVKKRRKRKAFEKTAADPDAAIDSGAPPSYDEPSDAKR